MRQSSAPAAEAGAAPQTDRREALHDEQRGDIRPFRADDELDLIQFGERLDSIQSDDWLGRHAQPAKPGQGDRMIMTRNLAKINKK